MNAAIEAHIADARAIYRAALDGLRPEVLLTRERLEASIPRPLDTYRRVVAVGAGKASMAMAGAIEAICPPGQLEGIVAVPHGYVSTFPKDFRYPKEIDVLEAGHPVPDEASAAAAQEALEWASSCRREDLLLVLISGGGSALWTAPADDLTLENLQRTADLLLRSGADIHQINTVRKHLSRIKGGRLAEAGFPATVRTMVISDVVGDDLSVIASGPTVPDRSTFRDAVLVLQQFDLWGKVPRSIRSYLRRGLDLPYLETIRPGDRAFERAETLFLANNRVALLAAAAEAERLGYAPHIVSDRMTGEAREVGAAMVRTALSDIHARPCCLLWGGETTVTVKGTGKGGRNQELALAAALALEGTDAPITLLSGGTDGRDGPTDAAGAWATPQATAQARALGLNPQASLDNNDAYPFFDALDALLKPGPTHTNVMDVQVVLLG